MDNPYQTDDIVNNETKYNPRIEPLRAMQKQMITFFHSLQNDTFRHILKAAWRRVAPNKIRSAIWHTRNALNSVYTRQVYLAYKYTNRSEEQILTSDTTLEWEQLHESQIAEYFFEDPCRVKTFQSFINRGFQGIVLVSNRKWISYAWMSPPGTGGPPHHALEKESSELYWIFWCRTRSDYQGKGIYKSALRRLLYLAKSQPLEADIFIDTTPDNVYSRRGIISAGFKPAGVITTTEIKIGWEHFRHTLWQKNKKH